MADFDITPSGPLRFGIALTDQLWMNTPGETVRIQAIDLRDLTHKAAAARDERPGVHVVVDIDVMIAGDAHSARAAMTRAGGHDGHTLLYVGTPAGLAGLIADIHALGIADGAVLVPVSADGTVVDLIRDVVVPELRTMAAA